MVVFAVHVGHYFGVILLQVHFCEHLSVQLEGFEKNSQAFLVDIVDKKHLLATSRVLRCLHIALIIEAFRISALFSLPYVRGMVAS